MQRFAFCSSSRGEKLSGHFLRVAFSFLFSFSFFFFFLVFWFSSSLRPFLSENYTHTEVKRGNVLQKIKSLLAHSNRPDLRSFQNPRERDRSIFFVSVTSPDILEFLTSLQIFEVRVSLQFQFQSLSSTDNQAKDKGLIRCRILAVFVHDLQVPNYRFYISNVRIWTQLTDGSIAINRLSA